MTDENQEVEQPSDQKPEEKKGPLREITQPFIDLIHAPRALWGINAAYFLEGWVYFGMLGYLAMYFNDYVGLSDVSAGRMVGVLTAGITISMFFLGGVGDKIGVRRALVTAFLLMLVGRVFLSLGPFIGLPASGLGSTLHLLAMGGILLVVVGYGLYQPSAYSAVKQFTSGKTAAMGFAMLYALMNLGGWMPTFFPPIRKAIGISGCYWVYVGLTGFAVFLTFTILTRRTVNKAIADAKAEREKEEAEKKKKAGDTDAAGSGADAANDEDKEKSPGAEAKESKKPFLEKMGDWFRNHPLADAKFAFFIFALIPVQTLFAHNWLTLPMYAARAFRGTWIGDNFEVAVNFNPLLIFILVPIVTALTHKAKVYKMMVIGTFVMAAPTFLLALDTSVYTLGGYLIIMTIGEAMWQPRFLQYAAQIAPEGRTGAYMGVAQFPWFLTKVLVPLYSGVFLQTYCPKDLPHQAETMWLVYACIAMCSTVLLIAARGWVGKDFKEQS